MIAEKQMIIYQVKVDNYLVVLSEESSQRARITAAHSLGKPVKFADIIATSGTTKKPIYHVKEL